MLSQALRLTAHFLEIDLKTGPNTAPRPLTAGFSSKIDAVPINLRTLTSANPRRIEPLEIMRRGVISLDPLRRPIRPNPSTRAAIRRSRGPSGREQGQIPC